MPASEANRNPIRGLPRLATETITGRLTVREVFPPRQALARGRGAMLLVSIALVAFATILVLVRRNRSALFDLRVTRAIQGIRVPGFDRLMRIVSWPGFPPQSRVIPPLLSLLWLALGFPLEAVFQLMAWGAGGISTIVKRIMRRPRPTNPHVNVHPARIGGSSFPSGHVLIYTGVYGFLAFLVATLVRADRIRRSIVAALVALVALVGPSRIYLGHHWFTDVIASYLLGASYLLALSALYRRVKTAWLNRRRGLAIR
ncbi:MAG: phosphatase PAP2 family protein [Thermomicrobiales bacterium]